MLIEIILAVTAVVVTLLATASESKSESNLPWNIWEWVRDIWKRIKKFSYLQWTIVAIGVLVMVLTIVKACHDEQNRDFMRVAVAANLKPTASVKKKLYEEVRWVAQKLGYIKAVDYNSVSDGMVFYLKNNQNEDEEIVFDNSELGQMYANQLSDKRNDQIIEDALKKRLTSVSMTKIHTIAFTYFC